MMSRIIPILSLIVAIAIFVGYVHPTYTKSITGLTEEIGNYNNALSAAAKFKEREKELTEERNAIAPESLDRLNAFLPEGVDNVQLILDLNALATRTGIHLTDFDVQSSNALSGNGTPAVATNSLSGDTQSALVDSLDISLSATGDYNSLHRFLMNVERSLRPLDIVSVAVSGSETGVYVYHLVFKIYWLR